MDNQPTNQVTIEPDAVSEGALDRLVVALARHLAEVEFCRQQEPDEGRDLHQVQH